MVAICSFYDFVLRHLVTVLVLRSLDPVVIYYYAVSNTIEIVKRVPFPSYLALAVYCHCFLTHPLLGYYILLIE